MVFWILDSRFWIQVRDTRIQSKIKNQKSALTAPATSPPTVPTVAITVGPAIGHVGLDQHANGFIPRRNLLVRRQVAPARGAFVEFLLQLFINIFFGGVRYSRRRLARRAASLRIATRIIGRPLTT